jgi:FixJ family two-component response regulator
LNVTLGIVHRTIQSHICFTDKGANFLKVPVIAIVDDDESFRRATTSFVRSLGYGTAAFDSAEAFLRSDRVSDTDCLITDVQMPGMTGIELQGRLLEQGHSLPVIFITAFPEMKQRAQALAAGAVGFLAKPFNDQNLITCLNEALARPA